jgi:hypothetical protein
MTNRKSLISNLKNLTTWRFLHARDTLSYILFAQDTHVQYFMTIRIHLTSLHFILMNTDPTDLDLLQNIHAPYLEKLEQLIDQRSQLCGWQPLESHAQLGEDRLPLATGQLCVL